MKEQSSEPLGDSHKLLATRKKKEELNAEAQRTLRRTTTSSRDTAARGEYHCVGWRGVVASLASGAGVQLAARSGNSTIR